MRKPLLSVLILFFGALAMAQDGQRVHGTITDGFDVIAGIKVEIEGQASGLAIIESDSPSAVTYSDSEGIYEIYANPRDILLFTGTAVDSLRIVVEDVTSRLNVEMKRTINELDEVVVTEKKLSRQEQLAMEYFTKPTIINTTFGYLDSERSAYHFYTIDEDKINDGAVDIISVIVGRVPGARLLTTPDGERRLILRGGFASVNATSSPIYEIDGMIFEETPFWLSLPLIKRIGIIPGLQAQWRYGQIASGGVVIINAVNGAHGLREEGTGENYDQARLRSNFATDDFLDEEDVLNNAPSYWVELAQSSELPQALEVIEKYRAGYSRDAAFFLQAYEMLYDRWGEEPADALIQENEAIFADHPVNLKSLAYLYEDQGRKSMARELYKKIFLLRPDYAQSYMDLAGGYYGMNQFEKSASLLMRYIDFTNRLDSETDPEGAESSEFELLMRNELVSASANMPGKGPKVESEIGGTRLVFAWTDAEAEFDLQFINPGNQYHKWIHSQESDADRIYQEKLLGYSSQEFFLDGSLPGQWEVRCTYKGNKKRSPSYLKMTVYRNFGMPNQTREVQTFRLQLKGVSVRLAGIFVQPSGVGR
ncbi:hypothetical protein SAMN04490243_2307 [Robiginitalea myxolifaciens]|uniref:Uncharacterized protein n=1 Tax=Robiginitalea myxolifaciens TaxID=400055 RepID=A0A1I6H607_9FLAO|nr:hypothetical protein [Robiginitalea myxolifaciens]SFR49832.1 hypothetical protein SAMN04490243_2307 [Robiginitalea myxolifaciens]